MTTHEEDSHKLQGDAYVDLFQIELTDGAVLYLKQNNTVTWQGDEYEGYGLKIEGVSRNAGDETPRPKLHLANPEGVFSAVVRAGRLDNALVKRLRVLKSDIETNTNLYREESWRVRRVSQVTREYIVLDLRDQLDGQFFLTPARMFIPPEFPQVTLK